MAGMVQRWIAKAFMLTVAVLVVGCSDVEETVVEEGDGEQVTPEEQNEVTDNQPSFSEDEEFIHFVLNAFSNESEEELEAVLHSSWLEEDEEQVERMLNVLGDVSIQSVSFSNQDDAEFLGSKATEDGDSDLYQVIVEGEFSNSTEREKYGENISIAIDFLIANDPSDMEVVGGFLHTPLPEEKVDNGEQTTLHTPERFVHDYYQSMVNEDWERLPELLASDWKAELGRQSDEEIAEMYENRIPKVEDAQVLMGEVFDEEIQQVIPELVSYKTEEKNYIVRAEYEIEGETRIFAEDLLITPRDDGWEILAIHNYESF